MGSVSEAIQNQVNEENGVTQDDSLLDPAKLEEAYNKEQYKLKK